LDGSVAVTQSAPRTPSGELEEELDPQTDHQLPETFTPLVGQNADIFGGKYFVVFSTVDKDSGIDHCEVAESKSKNPREDSWVRAESPYLLTDQTLTSYIIVKAVDKAGNYRTETIRFGNPQTFYQSPLFWFIIIIVFSILLILARKFKKN